MPKLRSEKDNKDEIIIKSDNDNEEQATQTEPLPELIKQYKMFEEKGNVYSGELKNDKKDGFGMMQYENGDTYHGEWENGCRTHGKMRFINGDVYYGKWKNGNFHGEGTYRWVNGNILHGFWENGVKVGGKLTYFEETPRQIIDRYNQVYVMCYEGEMTFLKKNRDVLFNGMGIMTLRNGNTCNALFIEGIIDKTFDKGVYTVKTGGTIIGTVEFALKSRWL
jgi:hypothetical protein